VTGAASIVAIAFPLALALATSVRGLRRAAIRIAPWGAAPAFVLAVGLPCSTIHSNTVLFGMSLGVAGTVTRSFVVLTASVWLAAGLFGRGYMRDDPRCARFWMFFLAAASGNFGLVLARDVASFYLFFALMTFAAYGLVVHEQSEEARRAGKVYLITALIGEMFLLAAFLLIVGANINVALDDVPRAVAGSSYRDLVVGLLLVGFGIKAGALVLHVWLPLAHPVAPTPASAVLSGAMINAGLLGWVRFLPLGIAALPGPGFVCLVAGLTAALYGVVVGLTQRDPKTILAYSSVSQMGFMTAAIGVALAAPVAAVAAVSAIVFYALHHAFAKAALFLGAGVVAATRSRWSRRLVVLGLAWSALDLAGAPLSSGALAKISLKQVMELAPWSSFLPIALLSVGAIGSALLMAHFLCQAARQDRASSRRGLWAPWGALLVLDIVLFVMPPADREHLGLLIRPTNVISAIWPVAIGVALFGVARYLSGRGIRIGPRIPPGDLVVVFEALSRTVRRLFAEIVLQLVRVGSRLYAGTARLAPVERIWGALDRTTTAAEHRLAAFEVIGILFVMLLLLLLAFAWHS
jgi:formate hydrogenlyase subunit 3/multisubunit Na+/H+ antiporter MnhD subunit